MRSWATRVASSFLLLMPLSAARAATAGADVEASTRAYHQARIAELTAPDGWLTLVGLYWLHEGDNTAGSAQSNALVFPPSAPASLGTFKRVGDKVSFQPAAGVTLTSEGKAFKGGPLRTDHDDVGPTVLNLGSMSFHVIRREGKVGIRVKDSQAKTLKDFHDIALFPANEKWRVTGKLVPRAKGEKLSVPNVLGQVEQMESPGTVELVLEGKTYHLDPVIEPGSKTYFFVFADLTNRDATYGAGRFLDTPQADAKGNVVLDFNQARNPPCAFTHFATCPLPPKQNRLAVRIEAGEKRVAER